MFVIYFIIFLLMVVITKQHYKIKNLERLTNVLTIWANEQIQRNMSQDFQNETQHIFNESVLEVLKNSDVFTDDKDNDIIN